jgi:hypothetical protein
MTGGNDTGQEAWGRVAARAVNDRTLTGSHLRLLIWFANRWRYREIDWKPLSLAYIAQGTGIPRNKLAFKCRSTGSGDTSLRRRSGLIADLVDGGYIEKKCGGPTSLYRLALAGCTASDPEVTTSDPEVTPLVTQRSPPASDPEVTPLFIEEEVQERTEETPPSGEQRARTRGEVFSNEVDRRQGELLLPFSGRADRRALLKGFNPSAATVDWAREQYDVNALDDRVLGKYIDRRIEKNQLPVDLEACEAGYRNWIRDEARFAEQSRGRSQRHRNTTEAEDAAAANFVERMAAAKRANGAGQ